MDKAKQWVALTAVGVLAVFALGWFLLVSPKRSDAAALNTKATQQLQSNQSLETQLETLKAQEKGVTAAQAEINADAVKIPNNPAMPSLIRALSKAASDAGVELVSIAPSTPTQVAATSVSTAPKTLSGAGTGSSTASAPIAPAAAAPTAGLQQIPVVINVVGRYFAVEQFFENVEKTQRALKVVGFSMAPGTSPTKQGGSASTSTGPVSTLVTSLNAMVYMSNSIPVATSTTPVAGK